MEATESSLKPTQIAQRVAKVLAELPMASARDLAAVMGCQPAVLYHPLRKFREDGLSESVTLGWTRERTARWFFDDKAMDQDGSLAEMEIQPNGWHDEYHRCRLLAQFPLVEWFYQVVGSVKEMGRFEAFQWLEGMGFEAAAKFEKGWIAIFWSGYLQTEGTIGDHLGRLSEDLRKLCPGVQSPWPSMLCYVVSDRWQAELVNRVTKIHNMDDMVSVWCVADGTRTGTMEPRPSRGWVRQPVYYHELGGWPWRKRVEDSPWSKERGVMASRVLDVVAQWPGITTSQCRQMLGESPTGRGSDMGLKILRDHGFVDYIQDGRAVHYRVSSRGTDCLVRRDRVKTSSYKRRALANSWFQKSRLRAHEEGVMSIMSQFAAAGVPVVPGWRSWEHLRDAAIAPDALVYLTETPLHSGWHYVEYERSARTPSRVEKKLAGYRSVRRHNDWPLMLVCWNYEVERHYQDVAAAAYLYMLTTNIKRLAEHGPMNNDHCWNLIDEPVVVGRLSGDKDWAASEGTNLVDGTVGAFSKGPASVPGIAS